MTSLPKCFRFANNVPSISGKEHFWIHSRFLIFFLEALLDCFITGGLLLKPFRSLSAKLSEWVQLLGPKGAGLVYGQVWHQEILLEISTFLQFMSSPIQKSFVICNLFNFIYQKKLWKNCDFALKMPWFIESGYLDADLFSSKVNVSLHNSTFYKILEKKILKRELKELPHSVTFPYIAVYRT